MRLKTHIRAAAHLRRAEAAGAFATIARRGDPDAGAIAIKVSITGDAITDRRAQVFYEIIGADGIKEWRDPLGGPTEEDAIDGWLEKETGFDPDLWIIEIEDREGRAFLD
ncbi:MAG: DUF1491 family protein [Pseudomonadota bacterium]